MTEVTFRVPLHFKPVDIKTIDGRVDIEWAQHTMHLYEGEVVLVCDAHNCLENHYVLARIRAEFKDKEAYFLQVPRGGYLVERIAHYHDLKGLMVREPTASFAVEKTFELKTE